MTRDLQDKLQRYGFLAGFGARNAVEQAEMQRLRAELRTAGIEPGWTECPQLTMDLTVFKVPKR